MGKVPCGSDVWEARGLPDSPLDAASAFASKHVPVLRGKKASDCIILLDPANHTHDSWRKAAIEELARENAPARINAIVGEDVTAIKELIDYLDAALGVTGQIFTLA